MELELGLQAQIYDVQSFETIHSILWSQTSVSKGASLAVHLECYPRSIKDVYDGRPIASIFAIATCPWFAASFALETGDASRRMTRALIHCIRHYIASYYVLHRARTVVEIQQ
eukprot:scaffold163049_cov18-Prasinocladus_malaysianus.AAC.1